LRMRLALSHDLELMVPAAPGTRHRSSATPFDRENTGAIPRLPEGPWRAPRRSWRRRCRLRCIPIPNPHHDVDHSLRSPNGVPERSPTGVQSPPGLNCRAAMRARSVRDLLLRQRATGPWRRRWSGGPAPAQLPSVVLATATPASDAYTAGV